MQFSSLTQRLTDHQAGTYYLASLAEDNSVFRANFRRAFFDALREQLTPRQYAVLWSREVELLSGREIAKKLGISESAVSRHLARGRKRLRVLLAYNLEFQAQRLGQYAR